MTTKRVEKTANTLNNMKKLAPAKGTSQARVTQLIESLAQTPKLEEIDFSDLNLLKPQVIALAKKMPQLPQLKVLKLDGNNMSSQSVVTLVRGLMGHPSCRELSLRSNLIEGEGAQAIAQWLIQSQHALTIDLSDNSFNRDEDSQCLQRALIQSPVLHQVHMSNNILLSPSIYFAAFQAANEANQQGAAFQQFLSFVSLAQGRRCLDSPLSLIDDATWMQIVEDNPVAQYAFSLVPKRIEKGVLTNNSREKNADIDNAALIALGNHIQNHDLHKIAMLLLTQAQAVKTFPHIQQLKADMEPVFKTIFAKIKSTPLAAIYDGIPEAQTPHRYYALCQANAPKRLRHRAVKTMEKNFKFSDEVQSAAQRN